MSRSSRHGEASGERRTPGPRRARAGGGSAGPVRPRCRRGEIPRATDARRLLRDYHEHGDLKAREQVIEAYVPLVEQLARGFGDQREQWEDLVQIGLIGLIRAVDRFELDRGSEFASYAVPSIAGEIRCHLRDNGWPVRLPRRLQELGASMREPIAELSAALDRMPTSGELASRLGVPAEEVAQALRLDAARVPAPLSMLTDESSAGGSIDEVFEAAQDRALVDALVAALDERERRIVCLRYFGGLSQSRIAAAVGLSQAHVSRLQRGALVKLREAVGAPP